MTEDETFKRLRRWTFEDISNTLPKGKPVMPIADLFQKTGWEPREWLEECFRRNEDRILTGFESKEYYLLWWLKFWNVV